mgnify:CR=1 FL=1
MEIEKKIAEKLREARQKKSLSQKELAKIADVAPATISAYEKGVKSPSLIISMKLAKALDISMDELCGFSQKTEQITIDEAEGVKGVAFTDILRVVALLLEKNFLISSSAINYGAKQPCLLINNDFLEGFIDNASQLIAVNQNGVLSDELYQLSLNGVLENYKTLVIPTKGSKVQLLDTDSYLPL